MSSSHLVPLPLLLILSACVTSGGASQLGRPNETASSPESARINNCVLHSAISEFHALDDRHVVLFTDKKQQAFLAEITGSCFNLEMQSGFIAVDGDDNGEICGDSRDSIAYRRLSSVYRCEIVSLEQLSGERRLQLGLGGPRS